MVPKKSRNFYTFPKKIGTIKLWFVYFFGWNFWSASIFFQIKMERFIQAWFLVCFYLPHFLGFTRERWKCFRIRSSGGTTQSDSFSDMNFCFLKHSFWLYLPCNFMGFIAWKDPGLCWKWHVFLKPHQKTLCECLYVPTSVCCSGL